MRKRWETQSALNISEYMPTQLTEGLSTREDLHVPAGLMRNLQKAVIEKILPKKMDHHLNSEHNPDSVRLFRGLKALSA